VESNPAFQEMLGYTKNDFEGTCLLDYLGRDDLSHKKMIYEDLFSGKTDHFHLEERYRRKDGSLIWTNERVSLLRDENGHPQYAIAMIENISIKKQMEAELYELERRLFEGVETDRLQLAQDLHDDPLQD
jgi:PAS domain S-box-containing protein